MIKNVKLDYWFKVEKDASVAPPRSQVVALDLDILFTRVYTYVQYNLSDWIEFINFSIILIVADS